MVALVIVVVLIAVGVNSCESSARKSALRDYANDVSSVISKSSGTSNSLFGALKGSSSGGATTVSQSINQTEETAHAVLRQAQGFSVPSAAKTANSHLLLALQMRLDGITAIAGEIQSALGHSVSTQAVDQIAGQMARFYASDVLYKDYTAPEIVSALHANGIAVGAANGGAPVSDAQFLPSLSWLTPNYVGAQLGVSLGSSSSSSSSSSGTVTGLHGDELNSVSVAGTTLSTAGNTVTASPAPTFDLSITDSGNFAETDVTCKVTVTGTTVSGTKIVPTIAKGGTSTCSVTLSSAPPTGTYNIVATVEKVPGEKNLSNNTLSYPVTFK